MVPPLIGISLVYGCEPTSRSLPVWYTLSAAKQPTAVDNINPRNNLRTAFPLLYAYLRTTLESRKNVRSITARIFQCMTRLLNTSNR